MYVNMAYIDPMGKKAAGRMNIWQLRVASWKVPVNSHECRLYTNESRKKKNYFPLYWLFNRDPYAGLL